MSDKFHNMLLKRSEEAKTHPELMIKLETKTRQQFIQDCLVEEVLEDYNTSGYWKHINGGYWEKIE